MNRAQAIKKILLTSSFFFVAFLFFSDKVIYTYSAGNPALNELRVAVIKDASQISLSIKGPYKIFTLNTDEALKEARRLDGSRISPTMSGLRLDEEEFKIYGIKIVPKKDSTVYVNNKRFRGSVDIIRTENLKLLLVNHIDIEDYLRGVLYNEVSHWWPMEALKAQAIAARTYALYQARARSGKDYDLTSDVYSQVYGGKFSERWRTDRAVKATRGKVLTYKGKIFPTYYHATCGGHTEDASNLWNTSLAPLDGTKCQFCKKSPHYRWKKEISLLDTASKLKKAGFKIGPVTSIGTIGYFPSGRVRDVEIKSETAALTIPAKDFRSALGNNFIRSTNFKIKIKGGKAFFVGLGWGHGVGMCQWGAYLMAKRHFRDIEILRFYYPGVRTETYKGEL